MSTSDYALFVPTDIVGPMEIAERLGTRRQTVAVWKARGLLPEPWRIVSGVPMWEWRDIERWARKTGRLSPR